jgi:hypothetical protein
MQELPFQEGRLLSPIVEEGESSTELLEYNLRANHSLDHQVADILAHKPTADAPQDEDEEHSQIRRAKNAKRAQRRRNAQNRIREPRDLNNAFAAVTDRKYRTLIGAIAEAALLAQQLPRILRYKGCST